MLIRRSIDKLVATLFKRAGKTPATVLVPHDPSMYTLYMGFTYRVYLIEFLVTNYPLINFRVVRAASL